MKALCWHGHGDVRIDSVPDPKIVHSRDAIIKITSTAICGSDLHLYDGYMPTMKSGDILGHEAMGFVVEVGNEISNLQKGDRVVIPFTISCGRCWYCKKTLFSLCENSNPNSEIARKAMGHSPAGIFGYSHMLGGYAGGQAEYLRVPFADVGAIKIPESLSDEQTLFLSDVLPTGYMAAENAEIEPGDTVAVWGCGAVGQFAIQSAWLLGAKRVIGIDRVPKRLKMAQDLGLAEVINFDEADVYETLQTMTHGRGPDRCIDAVGCEAHGMGSLDAIIDKAKAAVLLTTDRAHVLREAIKCCRKGGTLSIPGVYIGAPDKIPIGALMNKALSVRTGQTHVQRYSQKLLSMVEQSKINPSYVITHQVALDDAPKAYRTFRAKNDGCVKVVLKP